MVLCGTNHFNKGLVMKRSLKFALQVLGLAATVAPSLGLACSPPPPGTPAYVVQQRRLENAISDKVVIAEIAKGGLSNTIASIDLTNGTLIRTTSGCEFTVEGDGTNQPVGTCYDFWPLVIKTSSCVQK